MNVHVRDNILALKDPPSSTNSVNEASDYTTTSTSFADIDATDMARTITSTGGDMIFVAQFAVSYVGTTGADKVCFDVMVDGVALAGDDGIFGAAVGSASKVAPTTLVYLISGATYTAGSHTVKLRWKVTDGGNTATIYAGAGTSKGDLHPQVFLREMS